MMDYSIDNDDTEIIKQEIKLGTLDKDIVRAGVHMLFELDKHLGDKNTNLLLTGNVNFIELVKKDWTILKRINDQTEEICLTALKTSGLSLQYIKEPTYTYRLIAVSVTGAAIQFIDDPDDQLCIAAVRQDPTAIKFIKKQTDNLCMEAVKHDGLALSFVSNKTFELCLEAVRQNGLAMQYVPFLKDNIDDFQLMIIEMAAIEQNSRAYSFIKHFDRYNLQLKAVERDGLMLGQMRPHVELFLPAVKQNGKALQYCKKQTLELCVAALKNDMTAIGFIKDQVMAENAKAIVTKQVMYIDPTFSSVPCFNKIERD